MPARIRTGRLLPDGDDGLAAQHFQIIDDGGCQQPRVRAVTIDIEEPQPPLIDDERQQDDVTALRRLAMPFRQQLGHMGERKLRTLLSLLAEAREHC